VRCRAGPNGLADPVPKGILDRSVAYILPPFDLTFADLNRSLDEAHSTLERLSTGATESFETSAARVRLRLLRDLRSVTDSIRMYLERIPDPGDRLRAFGEADALRQQIEDFTDREVVRDTVNEIRRARDEAVESADHAKEAAGITGSVELSEHLSDYADVEQKTANWLRVACIFVTLSIAAFAGFLLLQGEHPDDIGYGRTSETDVRSAPCRARRVSRQGIVQSPRIVSLGA
jgi:hypothetical protein